MKELAEIDWADAFSRFHPVLLHLPVGLFVALIWLQVIGVFKGLREGARGARTGLVSLLMISTPAAAVSGWLLNEGAKYPDPVDWHKWLGVALALMSVFVGFAHFRGSKSYTPLLWLSALLLIPTAHFGGSLTHGDDFLTEPWIKQEASPPAVRGPAPTSIVLPRENSNQPVALVEDQPPTGEPVAQEPPVPFEEALSVFEDLCTRCHGERKQRGGLSLHTLEAVLAGGDSGPAVVFGDPDASLLLKLMHLPLDHDDHMPPENKAQPEPEEIALLEEWVRSNRAQVGQLASGAPDVEGGGAPAPTEEEPESDKGEPPTETPLPEGTPEGPVPESAGSMEQEPSSTSESSSTQPLTYFASLAERQIHVQALAPGSNLLWIDLSTTRLQEGELRELLGPVADRVGDLCLARKRIGQEDLRFLASLPALDTLDLRRLDLPSVASEPEPSVPGEVPVAEPASATTLALDITPLAQSKSIRVLNLAGTALSASAIDSLAEMTGLKRVSLAGTGQELQAAELMGLRADLQVNLGSEPRAALEVEPEVKFELPGESE